ncbi:MAG: flagellar motor protein MotA [Alphaproteobacteria bacterium]|nr:MAG: flagellar motor protein MotA [Alphaproteobacteria bacterium]
MILFVLAVLILAGALADPLIRAFLANPLLNGAILAVLVIGIAYNFRQVLLLAPEIEWIASRGRKSMESSVPARPPRLLAPIAALFDDHEEEGVGPLRLTTLALRSLLDGVEARLEEAREISRYLTRLLVFLGLLGTFWGLLSVLAAIGQTIGGLSVESGNVALLFESLKQGLERPLDGMAVAFSSSLFGLAGSLVLGFLDLQTGQAQRRFLHELEDWLNAVVRLVPTAGGGDAGGTGGTAPDAFLAALMEQVAEGLAALKNSADADRETRAELNATLVAIDDRMAAIQEGGEQARQSLKRIQDAALHQQTAFDRLIHLLEEKEWGLDTASRDHLRRIDQQIARLIAAQGSQQERLAAAFHEDILLLARTIAHALERAGGSAERPPETGDSDGQEG